MKTVAITRIKMPLSVSQSIGIYYFLRQAKIRVSIVFGPSRDFLVLRLVLKTVFNP